MQDLIEEKVAREFYDERYEKGYMEDWPDDRKKQTIDVIKLLNLPKSREVLDFGCGSGVFTEVLKKVLPGWKIYGSDISESAVKKAQKTVSGCTFFVSGDEKFQNKTFDLIYSHHVLEHVQDIKETAKKLARMTKEKGKMLHVFPCGDKGSFEWKICGLRKNGIDKKRENRFFFEEESHMRRMTTESCSQVFKEFGFKLKKSFYGNQYWGAVNWITRSHPKMIFGIFNPVEGKNLKAKISLLFYLNIFMFLSCLRLPYLIYKKIQNTLLRSIFFIPTLPAKFLDKYIVNKFLKEWEFSKTKFGGSEMYLYFER